MSELTTEEKQKHIVANCYKELNLLKVGGPVTISIPLNTGQTLNIKGILSNSDNFIMEREIERVKDPHTGYVKELVPKDGKLTLILDLPVSMQKDNALDKCFLVSNLLEKESKNTNTDKIDK